MISASCAVIGGGSFASPNIEGIQIYQKNLHLSPEHKQKLADDITRYRNADNLWDVLRESFALQHYENNPAVQDRIDWFMNNQDFLLRSASRAAPYLYYILQQVKVRHLPAELVLLPIVESGYNPFNVSNMGAVGLWQLMPETASGLGVKQDWWYDGRRDVIASTRAALNYLAYLQSFFEGNWLYAIGAYNTGEGNILSAIKRNIRSGADTDFWSLPVAKQTKLFVPSLLALAVIISHPERYPIYFPPVRNAPYLAQVDVGKQINLKYAASLAGISYKKLKQLNPGFTRLSTSLKGPYKLILPIETIEQFTENLSHSPLRNKQINWIHYNIKSGDTLAAVAKKFATTPNDIRKLNHLTKNTLHHGSTLLIPINDNTPRKAIQSESSFEVAANENENIIEKPVVESFKTKLSKSTAAALKTPAINYSLKPGDTIYMVRKQDSLKSIAKRFHVNKEILQAVNQLQGKKLQPGKQIIIPTHLAQEKTSIQPSEIIYVVKNNDSIEKIAKRFQTTPSAIRIANLLSPQKLREGDRLIIPTNLSG
jgi:peptidoglycan lytic transglycosylase D